MRTLFRAFLLVNLALCTAPVIQAQDETDAQKRMRANQLSAVRSLRTINTACVTYSATYGIGYPSALDYLGASGPATRTAASLIDDALARGEKDGYKFTYTPGAPFAGTVPVYILRADPAGPGETGRRHYFTDPSGVIRWNDSAPAAEMDPAIDEVGGHGPEETVAKAVTSSQVSPESPGGPSRIRIDGDVMKKSLTKKTTPVYPPLAQQVGIAGTVRLRAIIATDGRIASLEVISGPPLLRRATVDAVVHWKYKPTLVEGRPVEVETYIDVVYQLGKTPK